MPKQYENPGSGHYLAAESGAIRRESNQERQDVIGRAAQSPTVATVEQAVLNACNHREYPDRVEGALAHGRDELDATLLAYRTAVAHLLDATEGLGVEIPRWLKGHAAIAEPRADASVIVEATEERKALAMMGAMKDAQAIVAASVPPASFQNENPHPQPDPSPLQLADADRDPRNPDRPERDETEPDPEHLPSPRQTADPTPEQVQDLNAGRPPRPRGRAARGATTQQSIEPPGPGEPATIPTPVHGDPPPGDESTVTPVEVATGTPDPGKTVDPPAPAAPDDQDKTA